MQTQYNKWIQKNNKRGYLCDDLSCWYGRCMKNIFCWLRIREPILVNRKKQAATVCRHKNVYNRTGEPRAWRFAKRRNRGMSTLRFLQKIGASDRKPAPMWWRRVDLNHRPPACQAGTLTNWATPSYILCLHVLLKSIAAGKSLAANGATGRTRTDGLRITNALLYQLSHSSIVIFLP